MTEAATKKRGGGLLGGAWVNTIQAGDCIDVLSQIPDNTIDCCVTSPPYYGLRDYGHAGQIGMEETPEAFIAKLVAVFAQVRRVLRPDSTLWVNIGDSYASAWPCNRRSTIGAGSLENGKRENRPPRMGQGLKEKDLIGIPWMLAFALRADGWYLRQDIIWHKPNPMPESVTDRCTKSHEYIFLLSKSAKYYYDHEAIKDRAVKGNARSEFHTGKTGEHQLGWASTKPRSRADSFKREGSKREQVIPGQTVGTHRPDRVESEYDLETRNKRSVWTVSTKPYSEAHFATFPLDLIVPCIKAGCPVGGYVLDPFMGAGTTALVARKLDRNYVGIELNPDYIAIANNRIRKELGGLF